MVDSENIRLVEDGVVLTVSVKPRSKERGLEKVGSDIVLKVSSPPIGGRANMEVVELLSEILGVKKRKIEIISGEKSRVKKILIRLDPTGENVEMILKKIGLKG